jgi:uridine kinase
MSAERIAAAVDAAVRDGIKIVGVDGPSGSGKSVLAGELSTLLAAPIVEIDDFISWDDFGGWWPRFDSQVLTPLSQGDDARYQARDWSDWYGATLGEWKTLRWAPIVIVEGVTCTRREAAGRLAYAIWVEADPALRMARGLARDAGDHAGAAQLWERWMRAEEAFFTADRTRQRADAIVDTSTFR